VGILEELKGKKPSTGRIYKRKGEEALSRRGGLCGPSINIPEEVFEGLLELSLASIQEIVVSSTWIK
jgi:hypothetical protein